MVHNELRSNVSEVADVRFGDTSSMLVALRMFMASSDSCLWYSLACTLNNAATGSYVCLAQSGMMVMVYVLPHVHVARASVERHLARRKPLLGLVVGGIR